MATKIVPRVTFALLHAAHAMVLSLMNAIPAKILSNFKMVCASYLLRKSVKMDATGMVSNTNNKLKHLFKHLVW